MTIDEKNILWLDMFPALSYAKKRKLLDLLPKGEDIKSSFLLSEPVKELLSEDEFNRMASRVDCEEFDKTIQGYIDEGIQFVTIYDENYPPQLKNISNPPLCLYCKGNLQLLNTNCISVVGTRKPTDYGVVVTKEYAKQFSLAGLTIVSGMAVGVDSMAHKTALENDGATIAVLAGGFHHIYPVTNLALFRQLTENNLVITEASPNTQPLAYLFPIRNRIIAGLGLATLVTEATEKSGSLSSCNLANEFDRLVFAVPGKINSPYSKGCNALIKQDKALITIEPKDVLDHLGINIKKQKSPTIQLDIKHQIVIDYIKFEKKTFQQISDYTNIPASELNSILLELELEGMVYKLANNSYIMA